jgi:poly-gamma-glutamate synthase PgsB/CapB
MIYFFLTGLVFFLIYIFLEYYILNVRLKKIPIRILVNGTRGKSTTVRILYQILIRHNNRVYAKTTGDKPEILEPNGTIRLIKRRAPANIAENIKFLCKWIADKTDAVVLESMALHLEMQRTLSHNIFKPTHTVITNILPDHQEIMGASLRQNTQVIGTSINSNSKLFISKSTDDLLRTSGIQTQNQILFGEHRFLGDFDNLPEEVINQSWSIVNSVSENMAWQKKHTKECFWEVWKSIDESIKWDLSDLQIEFWNLFSINDIRTTSQFIDNCLSKSGQPVSYVLLLNCRQDRPLRTKYFIGLIADIYHQADIWLTGDGRRLAYHMLKKNPLNQLTYCVRGDEVWHRIRNGFSEKTLLFGIGNYKGMDTLIQQIKTVADCKQN